MTEWGKVSGNETCYDFVREIGEKYNWNMWDRVYHAVDICVGQAFIEMYRKLGDKRMLQPVMERAYYVATHPSKAPLLKTRMQWELWNAGLGRMHCSWHRRYMRLCIQ